MNNKALIFFSLFLIFILEYYYTNAQTVGPCVPLVDPSSFDGSFETGTLLDWTVVDFSDPSFPMEVVGAGEYVPYNTFFDFFLTQPVQVEAGDAGQFVFVTGFDGNGPGIARISTQVVIESAATIGSTLYIEFFYRLAWDTNFPSNLATDERNFRVTIDGIGAPVVYTIFTITGQIGRAHV